MTSIDSLSRELCTGCTTCQGVCPVDCIEMVSDRDGFQYPSIDPDRCIECGRCTTVCPPLTPNKEQWAERAYAAINRDKTIREASTSGGIFTALAETILARGGVVYGAIYDSTQRVTHIRATTQDQIAMMRGSKYAQSDMSGVVSHLIEDLRVGLWVLFSGTQCQADGVRRAVGESLSTRLLLVDMICHGVPSPLVLNQYQDEIRAGGKLQSFAFRSKEQGSWRRSHTRYVVDGELRYQAESMATNDYFYAFLKDLSLRPSCYRCPSKGGRSGSDLTIADFWGLDRCRQDIDDNRGCSLVLVVSKQGSDILEELSARVSFYEVELQQALLKNPSYGRSVVEPVKRRERLFALIRKGRMLSEIVDRDRRSQLSFWKRCRLLFSKSGR